MELKAGTLGSRIDLLQTFVVVSNASLGTFWDRNKPYTKIIDSRTEDGEPLDPDRIRQGRNFSHPYCQGDTTGIVFQALMHFIVTQKPVYDKLMAEVDQATKTGHLSDMPRFNEVLQHCPYYIACAKETLRLYPSTPNLFARLRRWKV